MTNPLDPAVALISGEPRYSGMGQRLQDLYGALGLNPAAPFNRWIEAGATVTLKPNWVMHHNPLGYNLDSLVTHPDLLFAVAEDVAKSLDGRGRIVIGDAPLQSCDFAALMSAMQMDERVAKFREAYPGIEVLVEDWRLTLLEGKASTRVSQHLRDSTGPMAGYRLVDRGRASFLEAISDKSDRFRVTCYRPSLMSEHHSPGKHEFLVTRRVLESDLVINLPKFKTHIKAGLTGALKNLVGINGHKEFLPHHIQGSSDKGGDCYRDAGMLRTAYDRLYDYTWEHLMELSPTRRTAMMGTLKYLGGVGRRMGDGIDAGSWSGNDTIWRTTLDLNHVLYQEGSGKVFHVVDGIVGGQGEGPLSPTPLLSGLLIAGQNPAHVDACMAALFGYRIERIRTVQHALIDPDSIFSGVPWRDIPVVAADARIHEKTALHLGDVPALDVEVPTFWRDALRNPPSTARRVQAFPAEG